MPEPREQLSMEDRVKSARALLKNVVQQIMLKTGLPPYMMDLVVCEALADVRNFELHWSDEPPTAPTAKEEGDENAVHEHRQ